MMGPAKDLDQRLRSGFRILLLPLPNGAKVLSTSSCRTLLSPGNPVTITVDPGPSSHRFFLVFSNGVCSEDYAMNNDYDSKFSYLMFAFFLKKGGLKKDELNFCFKK